MVMKPATWREHAAHARQMANEYRAEGNARKADQRDADADWYEYQAKCEEWRLSHTPVKHKDAA